MFEEFPAHRRFRLGGSAYALPGAGNAALALRRKGVTLAPIETTAARPLRKWGVGADRRSHCSASRRVGEGCLWRLGVPIGGVGDPKHHGVTSSRHYPEGRMMHG